jgi:hypothetical protein
MDVITFKTREAAEDAVGSIFTDDGARRLADFIPLALQDASSEAIRIGDGCAILPMPFVQTFCTSPLGLTASSRHGQHVRIGLKRCVIEGPLGLVGAAVRTAAPNDDSRLEDWLSVWRSAQDS